MSHSNPSLGYLTMFGSWFLICYLAYAMGAFPVMFEGVGLLLTGNVTALQQTEPMFGMMLGVVLAVVAAELVTVYVSSSIEHRYLGPMRGRHENVEATKGMTENKHFLIGMLVVVVEEVVARWFFLGFLPMWGPLSGPVMFYVLFLVGNGLFALIHLWNFHDPSDRHPLRTLTQFVAGIFYTYLFVAYGLTAAILAHFACNALLYASHRKQRFDIADIAIIGYSALCAVVSYWLMDKPLSDVEQWFSGTTIEGLPSWGVWDYVLLFTFVSSAFNVVMSLLLYDRGNAGKKFSFEFKIVLILPVVLIAFMLVAYWLAGFMVEDELYRALTAALVLSLMTTTASGSATSRVFWRTISTGYLTMCTVLSLGVLASLPWMAAMIVIGIPNMFLAQFDD